MRLIPPASTPSTWLLGLLTPFVIMVGVVVLLLLPNLIMRGAQSTMGSTVPVQGHAAGPQSAAAGMGSAIIR